MRGIDDYGSLINNIDEENVSHDLSPIIPLPLRAPSINNPSVEPLIKKLVETPYRKMETMPSSLNDKVNKMKDISSAIKKAKQIPPSKKIVELW
jgi:hypothetical protein